MAFFNQYIFDALWELDTMKDELFVILLLCWKSNGFDLNSWTFFFFFTMRNLWTNLQSTIASAASGHEDKKDEYLLILCHHYHKGMTDMKTWGGRSCLNKQWPNVVFNRYCQESESRCFETLWAIWIPRALVADALGKFEIEIELENPAAGLREHLEIWHYYAASAFPIKDKSRS